MKICVAGLGLIGGSLCLALKHAGYKVDGWNRSAEPLNFALKNKIIDGAAKDFSKYDVVFVALPPEATVAFICNTPFKDGAIISDICGVKKAIEDEVYKRERNFRYVGCHPMAGKEVSGIENAEATLFDRASMILTSCARTDEAAAETIRTLIKGMGFKRLVECSAKTHDKKIAYTSQLAHVVSNAYVKDDEIKNCLGFTGGSFQDMTRIAGVDEGVWSSLYLLNGKNLSDKLDALINSLTEIAEAVRGGDKKSLEEVLARGRRAFENCKAPLTDGEITVKELK